MRNTTGLNLEDIIISEISQSHTKKTNIVGFHLLQHLEGQTQRERKLNQCMPGVGEGECEVII